MTTRLHWTLPLVLLVCASTTLAAATSQPSAEDVTFSPAEYLAHVRFLASDALAGRQPGTPGIEAAAAYIAAQFECFGLEPGGTDGTWFQEFTVTRGKQLVEAEAELEVDGLPTVPRVGVDWIPLPFSAMDSASGPVAFAGYGIKADEFGWNDYAEFDATGKILLILRFEPRADDDEADFGGARPSRFSEFRSKAATAARRGAKALLIVDPPGHARSSGNLFRFSDELSRRTFDIPVAHVSAALAEAILEKAGAEPLATLVERLEKEGKPLTRDLGLDVSLRPGVRPLTVATRNVIARLPAAHDTTETIVVGAHYDHLGNVPRQFERTSDAAFIHNGADDNASGTAAVLELARALARERDLRRNIVFVAFSAEEMGLHGSKHFVRQGGEEIAHVKAMINFDMVGRVGQERFTIFGIPSAPEFEPIVKAAADRVGLTYRAPRALSGNSDHAPFLYREIPYLFPFTGMHRQYHRPEDDTELIDAEGAARLLTMFHAIIRDLADLRDGPTFQRSTEKPSDEDTPPPPAFEQQQQQQQDNGQARAGGPPRDDTDPDVGQPQMPRVRLGIVPDYATDGEPGVVIQAVTEGGPAKAAGLKDEDRIVKIGDQPIKDIYGYMAALKNMRPGQTVPVTVVREGKELTIEVKLGEGSGGRSRE